MAPFSQKSKNQIATNDRTTLASIVTDAIDKWIKNYEKNRHRHNLILYSDQMSLRKVLDEIDKLASDNWLKSYCGQAKHPRIQILNKRKWVDAAEDNRYKEFLENTQESMIKVLETNSKVEHSRRNSSRDNTSLLPLTISFLVEDLAREESVKKQQKFVSGMKQSLSQELPTVLQTQRTFSPDHLPICLNCLMPIMQSS